MFNDQVIFPDSTIKSTLLQLCLLGDIKNYHENVSFILNKMNKAKILSTPHMGGSEQKYIKKLPTPIDRQLVCKY
jgi:hypothetical protein